MSALESCVVIVGAGHGGAEAATALRQAGYAGRIVMIGDEPHLPYHRPPLSKAYLGGSATAESLLIKPAATYEKANVEVRLGIRVERIDRATKTVALSDGSALSYSSLVLAPGSRPRPLSCPGLPADARPANLFYLRTKDDVDGFRPLFTEGARLVVIGGGYIGLELAAVACKFKVQVTVLEAQPRVLARVAAPQISAFFEKMHRDAGVDLRVNAQIERVTTDQAGKVTGVVTTDGTEIDADLMVVGIGVLPNAELAADAGLTVDNGIVVDEFTRTSDPDIYAIGDCSNHPNPIYGRRVRLESVPNALEQARIAAACICGKPQAYASLPWFWSDQFDVKLQMAGLSQGYNAVAVRGNPETRSFAIFYLQDGVPISADCVNRPQEFMLAKKLIAGGKAVDAAMLSDENVPLKSLLEAAGA